MIPNPHDQIDSYLRNELSSGEVSTFEAQLASNPELQEQFRFEQTVKEGISQYRKAELKARLDALEVGTTWGVGQIGGQTIMKVAGGVITAAVIGLSVYFITDEHEVAPLSEDTAFIEDFNYPKQAGETTLELSGLEIAETTKETTAPGVQTKVETTIEEPVKAVEPEATTAKDKVVSKEYVPVVAVPDLGEPEEGNGLKTHDANLPEMSESDEVAINGTSPIDVETIQKDSEVLKYKYFEGRLFLYGDFKASPYEILEINSASQRKLYLYHKDGYYAIDLSDKVQELAPITNQKLVQELEIVRNNKR